MRGYSKVPLSGPTQLEGNALICHVQQEVHQRVQRRKGIMQNIKHEDPVLLGHSSRSLRSLVSAVLVMNN